MQMKVQSRFINQIVRLLRASMSIFWLFYCAACIGAENTEVEEAFVIEDEVVIAEDRMTSTVLTPDFPFFTYQHLSINLFFEETLLDRFITEQEVLAYIQNFLPEALTESKEEYTASPQMFNKASEQNWAAVSQADKTRMLMLLKRESIQTALAQLNSSNANFNSLSAKDALNPISGAGENEFEQARTQAQQFAGFEEFRSILRSQDEAWFRLQYFNNPDANSLRDFFSGTRLDYKKVHNYGGGGITDSEIWIFCDDGRFTQENRGGISLEGGIGKLRDIAEGYWDAMSVDGNLFLSIYSTHYSIVAIKANGFVPLPLASYQADAVIFAAQPKKIYRRSQVRC